MNMQETAIVLSLISGRYPNGRLGEREDATVQAWQMALADVPLTAVQPLLARWFRAKRFPPDPSEIRKEVLVAAGLVPNGETAWSQVRDHAKKFYPGQGWKTEDGQEPDDLLPPVHAAYVAVGRAKAVNDDVTLSTFLKVYSEKVESYSADLDISLVLDALPAPPNLRRIG